MYDFVLSSGHGLHVSGARDIIDEVTEARRVVDRVGEIMGGYSAVSIFHDDVSRNDRANLAAIVDHHNRQARQMDVSIHFNAVGGGTRDAGIGVEVLYRAGDKYSRMVAGRVARLISEASGLILRRKWSLAPGTLPASGLAFLNNTTRPAILVEVCFVNSRKDVQLYKENFDRVCYAIAEGLLQTGFSSKAKPEPEVALWAQDAWEWAKAEKIMDGTRPRDAMTRQEAVTMLHRVYLKTKVM